MKEFKISQWQIDKLREGINNTSTFDDKLKEQCLLILEAIEHTEGTEMKPINIPSCWIADDTEKIETTDGAIYTFTSSTVEK